MPLSSRVFLEKAIHDHKVMVFSKSYSSDCTKAKSTLKEQGVDYFVYEMDVSK